LYALKKTLSCRRIASYNSCESGLYGLVLLFEVEQAVVKRMMLRITGKYVVIFAWKGYDVMGVIIYSFLCTNEVRVYDPSFYRMLI
jgi:hypothetical protein